MQNATTTLALYGFGARLRVKDGLFAVTVPDLSGLRAKRCANGGCFMLMFLSDFGSRYKGN